MLDFLRDRFPRVEAAHWRQRMERHEVADEAGRPLQADSPHRAGMRVYYYRDPPPEAPLPFTETVIYRDEHIVVADKPHFLPVVPAGRYLRETLLVRLRLKLGLDALVPVHRIDRETAGVVLFCVRPAERGRYEALFRERRIVKRYEALARPAPPELSLPLRYRSRLVAGAPFFRMCEAHGEPNAETHIEWLERHADFVRYRLTPLTGRTHQLRVQMAALGMPILNDPCYPELQPSRRDDDYARPLQLLAKSLRFTDPVTGREHVFTSRRQLAGMEGPASTDPTI